MMRVSHAILHAFDFESGTSYPSDRELDLGSRPVKSYVQRHMRKIASSAESRHGTFAEDSSFGAALAEYFAGRVGFVELSQQLAQFMWEQLRMCDDLVECDLLVCDFTDTKDMRARAAVLADGVVAAAVSDDPAAVGSEDLSQRLFGMAVLPRRQAFVHDLGNDVTGAAANDILSQDATLPNPSQKVDSYLLVDLATAAIDFRDKPRAIGGREVEIIPERLLQCSSQASSRELVEAVEDIVEGVAEEHGLNAACAVAHAKACVAATAERDESFSPEEVGRQVFEGQPEVQEHYERVAHERKLPEEVPVRRGVANRLAKSHKIKTDTGIEITFPSEYAADSNYIEFTADADGNVSILIKNVGRIENR